MCDAGVGGHLARRALRHDAAARVAAFGAEVDQPVAGGHHVKVVLDDDERVPRIQQLAKGPHELGNVVKVQAGGGLVKQKQRAFFANGLARLAGGLRGFCKETGQLQTLRLAAAERGHGLAQRHVVQPHVHNGLQGADDFAVGLEQLRRLGHGQGQHVGHVQLAATAFDAHFQRFGAVALAVAVGAAQVHVGEELHLHMLEAAAAAGGAAPVAAVE